MDDQQAVVTVLVADGPLCAGIATALLVRGIAVIEDAHGAGAGPCGRAADVAIVDVDGPTGFGRLSRVVGCPTCHGRPLLAVTTFPDAALGRRVRAAGADAVALKRAPDAIADAVRALAGDGAR